MFCLFKHFFFLKTWAFQTFDAHAGLRLTRNGMTEENLQTSERLKNMFGFKNRMIRSIIDVFL